MHAGLRVGVSESEPVGQLVQSQPVNMAHDAVTGVTKFSHSLCAV